MQSVAIYTLTVIAYCITLICATFLNLLPIFLFVESPTWSCCPSIVLMNGSYTMGMVQCAYMYHVLCVYIHVSCVMCVHTCIMCYVCTYMYHVLCVYIHVSCVMSVHTCIMCYVFMYIHVSCVMCLCTYMYHVL